MKFNEELCTECGLCFNKCPVLKLPIKESKKEITRLLKNKKSRYVLSKCNTCFSCNLYCPEGANPYQLILERWNQKYKDSGAPPLYVFVCPTYEPNIWQLLNIFLTNKERKWIFEWMYNKPKLNDIILLIGNYTHLFPFIIGGSKILRYFNPVDLIDHWEGGAYLYQGGYLDIVKKIAQKTKEDFDKWKVKKIVSVLDAVEYIHKIVHPKEMDVNHDQEFLSLNEWMLKKIETNEIRISNILNMTVTIHDNCYSKAIEDKYWNPPRKILDLCGCTIKEMKHIKKDSLCCGFGAGASWVKNISIPFDIISEGIKKYQEAIATGADALVTYCGGCLYLLWATKELMGYQIELYHIIEVVRMAIGEKLNYPRDHIARAWDIISIITYELILSLFKKNFFINKIEYDKEKSAFIPKNYPLLRIIRVIFNLKIIRRFYSKLFQIMIPLLKTR
ncbi:MAG: (Fe-S)-binding protein [Candidatus Lokiarchaeota archaeon]